MANEDFWGGGSVGEISNEEVIVSREDKDFVPRAVAVIINDIGYRVEVIEGLVSGKQIEFLIERHLGRCGVREGEIEIIPMEVIRHFDVKNFVFCEVKGGKFLCHVDIWLRVWDAYCCHKQKKKVTNFFQSHSLSFEDI